ncbi:P-loop containing nucleoside triphosphate hydrolase protein [Chytridium lagenaria]|nr:P-loop containing nucleoside triphosphate hydrolase protein [Chytridium lagenaria]
MPPKKTAVVEKPLLGRPGNNLKMGIVGLPNVGKSSFFNALTNSAVPSENFPFCTIDPSEARVVNQDPCLPVVFDIAGLVKGAAEGQGLGNAFLSHIRAVDGTYLPPLPCVDDADVIHVENTIDPVRDLEIIHEELRLKDEELIIKQHDLKKKDVARLGVSGDKAKKEEFESIKKIHACIVEQKKDVREGDWSSRDIEVRRICRKKNKWLPKIKAWIDEHHPGDVLIPYSGVVEQRLAELETQEEKEALLKELGTKYEAPVPVASALPKIILTGYAALKLCYFFTCGPMEVRCWTIRQGTKAPQAAGVIHTDFEKGFIMAEIMRYEDLIELGSENAVKAAGKYMQKGRETVINDGDIIHFKAGQVTAPKKK